MTNLDIETFWAVVQHGTMTAAAEALYITQPTLSMRVRALEERVGTPLFIRSKGQRRIQLTDAGQKFLTLARRWQRLLAETDALSELEQRVYLRIAATYTTNQYILPAVYQRFLSLHLPVSLWIHTLRDVDSAQALLNHELDFALIGQPLPGGDRSLRAGSRQRDPGHMGSGLHALARQLLRPRRPPPAVRRHPAGRGFLSPHGGSVGGRAGHRRRLAGSRAGAGLPLYPSAAGSDQLSGDAAGRGIAEAGAYFSGRSAGASAGAEQCAGIFVKKAEKRVDTPCFLA